MPASHCLAATDQSMRTGRRIGHGMRLDPKSSMKNGANGWPIGKATPRPIHRARRGETPPYTSRENWCISARETIHSKDDPMHDIRAIRDNPDAFDAAMARRGLEGVSADILALDEARRGRIHAAETAQAEQNRASKDVGAAKASGDEAEFERLRALVAEKKAEVAAMQAEAKALDDQLRDALMGIPNLPHEDVPEGSDEADNVEIRRWGTPRVFAFKPKEHYEITGVLPGMDFETAAKLSGSRFVLMRGGVARIHRALAQFMLDLH